MKSIFISIVLISSILPLSMSNHHKKDEWKSRSIYQLLTDRFSKDDNTETTCADLSKYCGGTFNGIKKNLDYIVGMGFDAIWISPPLKNKEGSYHGYHNIDINSINEHFGTAEELKDLIKACHDKDIWVILDAVPNHMAGDLDISTFIPFNKEEYYHMNMPGLKCDPWDDNNQTIVENCPIWGMPDLAQENEFVKEKLLSWLKTMIDDYGFDGVRYADVRNVPKWFWGNFTKVANTYTLGIVSSENADYISDYQNYMDGVGDYPLYYTMRKSFSGGSMTLLKDYYEQTHPKYLKPQYNGIWFSNHDNPRFLNSTENVDSFKNAIIFTLFYEGIPIFYYGDEQLYKGGNDPNNREVLFGNYKTDSEIYQMVKIANKVRKENKIYDKELRQVYADNDFYIFTRGDVLIAVSNGKSNELTITDHGYKNGDKLCNQLDEKDCVAVVGPEFKFEIDKKPKIYVKVNPKDSGNNFIKFSFVYLILIFVFLF